MNSFNLADINEFRGWKVPEFQKLHVRTFGVPKFFPSPCVNGDELSVTREFVAGN